MLRFAPNPSRFRNLAEIYYVTANTTPDKPLSLDRELGKIMNRIPGSWPVRPRPAAKISEIVTDLMDYAPDIVHFSGHGTETERLELFDELEQPKDESRKKISELFRKMKGKIRLVVLNACYSKAAGNLIARNIDCVLGVRRTLQTEVAILFSEMFYASLARGNSVQHSYDMAMIVVADVAPEEKPDLLTREGLDADSVTFAIPAAKPAAQPELRFTDRKKSAFDDARAACGVSAERVAVMKLAKADGSSVTRYEIANLTAEGEISALRWRCLATKGSVRRPRIESPTDASVMWVEEQDSIATTIEEEVKIRGALYGKFEFDPPLKKDRTISFAWTVEILNADALTVWEFYSRYSKQEQRHLSGRPLGTPMEYFGCLVWFPVEELRMSLQFEQPRDSSPRFRYFELGGAGPEGLSKDRVVFNSEVWSYPRAGDGAAADRWNRNTDVEKSEKTARSSGAQAELTVAHPTAGSYYALEWDLPDLPLPEDMRGLADATEEIRAGLLAHRAARYPGPPTAQSKQIAGLFRKVHEQARAFLKTAEKNFSTSLMTWDRENRRLVTVEIARNEEKAIAADWEFWAPFGLGIGGACFRAATGAFRYRQDLDHGDAGRPENYLPVPGTKTHAYLLAVPIDHPDMTEEIGSQRNAQRCRQLVGVLTFGSWTSGSALGRYCAETFTQAQFERFREFRDSCQRGIDAISLLLLQDAGIRTAQDTDADARSTIPIAPRILPTGPPRQVGPAASAGILLQPGSGWKAPTAGAGLRLRVAAFDLDGSLLRGNGFAFSWEMLWQSLGFSGKIQTDLKREYHRRADKASPEARAKAYREWCEAAVQRFQEHDLTRRRIQDLCGNLRLTGNCRQGLKQLRNAGFVTALISGGISTVLETVFPDYREYFDFVFINELTFDENDTLAGVNASAYDFEGKADALELVCERAGTTVDQSVFVGDMFNDKAAMLRAKLAIAFPAVDNEVQGIATAQIKGDDLMAVVARILWA
jgi:phosphoserine phosphatase